MSFEGREAVAPSWPDFWKGGRRMRRRSSFLAALCVVAVIGSGCASFPQNELPRYGPESIEPSGRGPAIDYDLTFSVMGKASAAGLGTFQERVQLVFGQSGAFSRFQAGIGRESHHLRLSLDNHGNVGLAAASGFISGLTFMVLPGYAKDEYTLVAEVSSGDRMLKRYEYHDSMATWFQILLIFAMPFNFPSDVVEEVIDNMIWNLIVDLERDGILEQEVSPSGSGRTVEGEGHGGSEKVTGERLLELKGLLDEGLVTQEQYEEMRREILRDL